MMERGYRPTGWLGLILGTRLWYPFHPEAVQTDESFTRQIEATVREIGERGKVRAVGVPEGLPPKSPAPAPAPAPAAARPMPATPAGAQIPTGPSQTKAHTEDPKPRRGKTMTEMGMG